MIPRKRQMVLERCNMVTGRCQIVTGRCQTVSGRCQIVLGRYQMALGRYHLVSGWCQVFLGRRQMISEGVRWPWEDVRGSREGVRWFWPIPAYSSLFQPNVSLFQHIPSSSSSYSSIILIHHQISYYLPILTICTAIFAVQCSELVSFCTESPGNTR